MNNNIQFDKYADELKQFWQEVVVENGPRYRDWRNWGDLWIDFWNAFFDMNYTLGHVVGIGLPLWGIEVVVSSVWHWLRS